MTPDFTSYKSPRSTIPERVMVFIDGGYLRKLIVDNYSLDINKFEFGDLVDEITGNLFDETEIYKIIRTYYYDGLSDLIDPEHIKQKEFFTELNYFENFEVRVGKLVRDGNNKFRQKAVDVLLAIDMIEKANENHYDVAIIIAGDLDHLEAVKAVKNKGKQVYGAYYAGSESEELIENVDKEFEITKKNNKKSCR